MGNTQDQILAACKAGDVEELRSLVNDLDGTGRHDPALFKKMLQNAAKSCQLSVVQYLISQDPRFTLDRETGLAVATSGSVEIYKALHAIDPNVISLHFSHTGDPITMAVSSGNVPVLAFLLEKGADPNAGRYLSRWSPIALAAQGSSDGIIPLLMKYGAQTSGPNALQNAVTADRLDVAETLLQGGADVKDAPDYHHVPNLLGHLETPLHTAVRLAKSDVVKKLLRYGADPNLPDSKGMTVMMRAQEKGRENIISALHDR